MNQNDIIYTQTDSGLNRFFAKIYGLVGMGIGLSASVSFLMLYVFTDNMINIMTNHPFIYYGAVFLELALVFLASGAARKNTPSALPLFLFYSALNGFTLSFIIVAYTQTTVLQAFVSSALVFGVSLGSFDWYHHCKLCQYFYWLRDDELCYQYYFSIDFLRAYRL